MKKSLIFPLFFFLFSCQVFERVNFSFAVDQKKKARKASRQEEITWMQIKNQPNLSFEERIKQLDQFIKENQNKETAFSAYLLKADLFLKNKQNQKACLTYHQAVQSSFAYSQPWKIYYESAQCYLREGKDNLAFEALQNLIQSSRAKKEDRTKALLLQWKLVKNKKRAKRQKLMVLSAQAALSETLAGRKKRFYKGVKIINEMSFQEKLIYDSQSALFPEFAEYLNYKIGLHYFENKEFQSAEKRLKKTLSSSLSDLIKKEVKLKLFLIKKISQTNPSLIGVILPLSGERKELGEKILRALFLGFNMNQNSSLQMVVLDSKNHPDVVRSHIEELFNKHHVIALTGGLSVEVAEVIAQKAEELLIPAVLLSQGRELTKNRKFVFQNAINSKQLLTPLIKELKNRLRINKAAIMYPDDSYGRKYSSFFEESFKKAGGQITERIKYKLGEVDFKDEVKELLHLKIKGRKREFKKLKNKILKDNPSASVRSHKLTPENILPLKQNFSAIFIPDSSKARMRIQEHLRYFGLNHTYLVGLNLWNMDQIKTKDFSVIFVNLKEEEKNKSSFYVEFFKSYSQAPGYFEQKAYNAAVFLKQALDDVKLKSRLQLQERLDSIKTFQGAYGPLSVSEDRVFQYPLKVYKKIK